ncbi:MAG: DUF4397 domain-containing protein [Ilumatobacter fluminis]|uniref:DUF4397 domain-containing protein n=1 Tax=Ilumatobacter fluminis TaxID=467091 RepID=UPI0032EF444B
MKRLLAGLAVLAAAAAPAAVSNAQDAADVTLLHGIPGATVDVAVDGEVVIPGFEPGDTQDLSAFAGQTLANLEVRAAGTEDVVIGPVEEFAVPASGSWTVVAHLDADGAPTVSPFENNAAPTADGEGRLTVRHTAAAPAVDLVVGDARPIEGAENGASADLDLPAGEIAGAQLAPAGGDPIVDVPTVNLTAGTNLIVYAVGSLEDETFTFFTQEYEVGTEAAEDGGTTDAPAAEDGDDDSDGDDAAAEGSDDSDGTPAPTAVNTGSPLADSGMMWAYALAAAAMVFVAGSFVVRHRTADVRNER